MKTYEGIVKIIVEAEDEVEAVDHINKVIDYSKLGSVSAMSMPVVRRVEAYSSY